MSSSSPPISPETLASQVKQWSAALGFSQCGISRADPGRHADYLDQWLAEGYHGEMDYMHRHAALRRSPDALYPGVKSVIVVRMDYLPEGPADALATLRRAEQAYVSRYTLGRDYHRTLRQRLAKLAQQLDATLQGYQHRAFVDSAPVLERGFAQQAGLGWIGKNTMLINRQAGSFFFLGEILTTMELPADPATETNHCGTCRACLDECPTGAFVGPYVLDARRCISYLTIELQGAIPEPLRPLIGNRVFGCDDCQLSCPWNRFAPLSGEADFRPRHELDNTSLATLFTWSEAEFMSRTEGSAIRRTGYQGWLRNLAVALGNAPSTIPVIEALTSRRDDPSPLVREHVAWALAQHERRRHPPR